MIGGWTIGSVAAMQSGGPFTVTTQTNATDPRTIQFGLRVVF